MAEQPTSVRLTREVREEIAREAAERQWSISTTINEILKQWFDWHRRRQAALAQKKAKP